MNYRKQIGNDLILGVQAYHDITCPLINALQFVGESASKIYKVELTYDPSDLKVDKKPLIQAIDNLDSWANGLLNIYNNLPDNIKEEITWNMVDYRERLMENHHDEVSIYQSSINGIIESWKDNLDEYNELLYVKKNLENELNTLEKKKIIKKISGIGETIEDINENIDYLNSEITETNELINDQVSQFSRYIMDDFTKETTEFSLYLEKVRERNEDLRYLATELKKDIMAYAKEHLNLFQPDEFLDLKFKEVDNKSNVKTLNIGILCNDSKVNEHTESSNFASLVIGLTKKETITSLQMIKILDKTEDSRETRKKILLDALMVNGFEKVRYYEHYNDFLRNKEFVTEQVLSHKIKHNNILKSKF